MFDRLDDTIVAISTAGGVGVRGILRLSGPQALSFGSSVFRSDQIPSLEHVPGSRRVQGRLRFEGAITVPAEAYVFRAPASYTRQDVVELHTIGSPPVLASVLEGLTSLGARPAEPGEFTARAFFSGALDLTSVEGVAALIHARSDAQLRASEALLHGQLARRSHALRESLADLLALIEAEIDFVEEPIDFVSQHQVRRTLTQSTNELARWLADAPPAERLDVLPQVLLVGLPNAGKSTLFNRLTGLDRAIQSATAGTTRDVIGTPAQVPGGEFTLLDSAGLAENREALHYAAHPVEALAEAAVRRALRTADLLLVVVDVTDEPGRAMRHLAPIVADRPRLIVANKTDRLNNQERIARLSALGPAAIAVSALTGEGISELRRQLSETLFSGVQTQGTASMALSGRQRQSLQEAREALTRALDICDKWHGVNDCAELLAMEIREAVNAFSLLMGEVTTEDLLGRVFSRFCIGK